MSRFTSTDRQFYVESFIEAASVALIAEKFHAEKRLKGALLPRKGLPFDELSAHISAKCFEER